jgi:hypothetical protein
VRSSSVNLKRKGTKRQRGITFVFQEASNAHVAATFQNTTSAIYISRQNFVAGVRIRPRSRGRTEPDWVRVSCMGRFYRFYGDGCFIFLFDPKLTATPERLAMARIARCIVPDLLHQLGIEVSVTAMPVIRLHGPLRFLSGARAKVPLGSLLRKGTGMVFL